MTKKIFKPSSELKQGTIRYYESKIEEIRVKKRKASEAGHEKKKEMAKLTPYKYNLKLNTKKPSKRYRSRVEYDFLKYIRVVFRWAMENNPDLNRPQIELLLYFYATGAFSQKQFNDYHKLVGMYAIKTLTKFQKDGWIKLWRPRKGKDHALYTLTQKGKILCNKMHKFSCGEESIPEAASLNNMIRKDAPRINNYYMDIIKRMNKDKASTEE